MHDRHPSPSARNPQTVAQIGRRLSLPLVAVAFALAGPAACQRSTQALVDVQLLVECSDGSDIGFLDVRALRIDVSVCDAPGVCFLGSATQLLVANDLIAGVDLADLSPMDPYTVLLDNLGTLPQDTWIRVWATALDVDMNGLATGTLDLFIDRGGLLEANEPLVLEPVSCGFDGEPDYDGDGYVGRDDCDNFSAAVNPGAEEICKDGIDNNCNGLIDNDDPRCNFEPDFDGDGLCATGIDRLFPNGVPQNILDACPGGFKDCDDNDENVGTHCPCDVDGDGYCTVDFLCPHNSRLGIDAVCAPGGDCCDEPLDPACPDGDAGIGPVDLNPEATEVCDFWDNDCDGVIDRGAYDAASCFAVDPAGVDCLDGVRCGGAGSTTGTCHSLNDPVDSRICESAQTLNCIDINSAAMGPPYICPGKPNGIDVTVVIPGQFDPGTSCSWDVVLPSAPFDVTPLSGSDVDAGCGSFTLGVVLNQSMPPGFYSFFVLYTLDEGPGAITTTALEIVLHIDGDPGTCNGTSFTCSGG